MGETEGPTATKPIVLHTYPLGPNPLKTAIVLEELGLPYEYRWMEFDQVHQEPYININPNGRVPAIEDPNTNMVLWESAAINEYLVQTYDKTQKLWCAEGPDHFYMKQWLYFQMSGQGPFYGQGAWFLFRHHEYLPSAVSRYRGEIRRIIGVMNKVLADKEYLVANRCTIADLGFIPWDEQVHNICEGQEWLQTIEQDYPHWCAWRRRLLARPAVQKVLADRAKALADAGPSTIPKNWEREMKIIK